MRPSTGPMHLSALRRILFSLILLGCGCRVLKAQSKDQRVVANSNEAPAGRLHDGQLTIRLEATMGEWSPEENDGPALHVAAFREESGPLSTPGPLLHVPEGTEIDATISNHLEQPLTVHGLYSRPGDAKEVLIVAPGESREVKFLAGAPGTYLYWASRSGAETTVVRRAEDQQLNGAFVVDARNEVRQANADRILMITDWTVVDDDTVQPPAYREVFAINGLSWPHTERLTYRAAETVHWRVINGVEPTGRSQSTATKSLIARNRSHTRKRAPCGRHIRLGLSCRVTSATASHSATVSGTTYSAPLSPARK
jgi:FtsP/CotA-like multicopper oxidase with cupredoxin domain